MSDLFNIQAPPAGFERVGNTGWLKIRNSPISKTVCKLKKNEEKLIRENIDLANRLQKLELLVSSLVGEVEQNG